ncbi:MAG TPA: hypothetical protein VJP79_09345, partial [Nitrososphaera sp.]|nr:hypothetical protein [Nitrososphaera sp.]
MKIKNQNLPNNVLAAVLFSVMLLGANSIVPFVLAQNADAASLTTITVKTKYDTGNSFSGATVILKKNGVKVDSKPSPATFTVTVGAKYTVTPKDTSTASFEQWTSGSTVRERAVTATTTAKTLTATYEKTTPTTSSCSGTAHGANTVTVVSCTLDGASIPGMYVNLRENGNIIADGYTPKTFNLTPGKDYVVVLYWCCDYYFRHYSDGTLTRYYTVTGESTGILLKGMYERVPASQAAKLNVIAKDTAGNVIGGTTSNPDGSISAEPGMWMWLTSPGASSPYTGAYTGSSSTPFVVFEGKTYKVTMSSFDKYQFDHWQDTGSTSPNRSFSMSGDRENNVAIYRIVSSSSATASAASTESGSMEPPPFIDVG